MTTTATHLRKPRLGRRLPDKPAVRSMSILVVDDAEADRKSLVNLLGEALGQEIQVRECDSGLAALEILRRVRTDVVLIDALLPDMSGLELISEVAEMTDDTAVILMSRRASGRMTADAMKNGARDYLDRQTLDAPALENAVIEALRSARLEWRTSRSLLQIQRDHEENSLQIRDVSRHMRARIDDLGQSIGTLKKIGQESPLRQIADQFSCVEKELRQSLAMLKDLSSHSADSDQNDRS